ncbi:hypothetical protein QBC44DRAFT_391790 [Cladorrhinum sp. PSN332]|nr:hypothetical protein QBC44DRAFT_391790 [Cladorrhinum sp. PSN332]
MRFRHVIPAATGTLLFATLKEATAHPLESKEPCERIQQEVRRWINDNNIVPVNYPYFFNLAYPRVPAAPIKPSLAYACLKSVPLHADTAVKHLEYLRPIFEWQSTLDYLKNPPAGYLSDAVDLLGGLDSIAVNIRGDGTKQYSNEFEFLADLDTLTNVRVRDFHLGHTAVLFDLFTFNMGVEFVSISKDGLLIPDIFLRDDVNHSNRGYTPSPVSLIDGIPVLDFLLDASTQSGGAHDPDARFNSLFPSLAKDASTVHTKPDIFVLNMEDSTRVELRNGTILYYDNTAFVRGNFTAIKSGRDLYSAFGDDQGTTPEPFSTSFHQLAGKNFTPTHAGYPEPLAEADMGILRSFLPETPSLSDVAVLSINSFFLNPSPYREPLTIDDGAGSFYNATIGLVQAAKASGRSRLILDMQSNRGGQMAILANLYLTLFPEETTLPLLTQFRAHPQLDYLLQLVNSNTTSSTSETMKLPWNRRDPQTDIQPNGNPWLASNISAFYGPLSHGMQGNYTRPSQINIAALGIIKPPWSTAPFHPENITILTDGECGSACAVLVSMLTHKHGIRTVTIGGRPQPGGPMQAIGMTKGGPIMSPVGHLGSLLDQVNRTAAAGSGIDIVSDDPPPLRVTRIPPGGGRKGVSIGVNLGNLIPWDWESEDGDGDVTPLQFRYEAADCRVFWTWEMMRDVTVIWERVREVVWGGGKCVDGSSTGEGGRVRGF